VVEAGRTLTSCPAPNGDVVDENGDEDREGTDELDEDSEDDKE
jgi:hypothetical protein